MLDKDQLKLLKHDVKAWNKWREDNPTEHVLLEGADLSGAKLWEANLSQAGLWDANLSQANLSDADLRRASLMGTDLRRTNLPGADLEAALFWHANLSDANLSGANLSDADLSDTNLSHANLSHANLSQANLSDANLSDANLSQASFSQAYLQRANLSGARLSGTYLIEAYLLSTNVKNTNFTDAHLGLSIFSSLDLGTAKGLDKAHNMSPSTIGTNTLLFSKGKIPKEFLQGCGLSDWEIEAAKLYDPDLTNQEVTDIQYRIFDLRAQRPLQLSSLFISYSHADAYFVDTLGKQLDKEGIRYWRDVHHATAGRLERVVDRAIRMNPTLLLVLSKDSVKSDWVEHEVRKARELEKELGRDVLCPMALDDAWKNPGSWSRVLMDQVTKYNVLDFSGWQDDDEFNSKFRRLLDGLDLFY